MFYGVGIDLKQMESTKVSVFKNSDSIIFIKDNNSVYSFNQKTFEPVKEGIEQNFLIFILSSNFF